MMKKSGVRQKGRVCRCCRNLTESCFREGTRYGVQQGIHLLNETATQFQGVTPEPKLERTVKWIHTSDGGSCPLLVMYAFCASPSYLLWCPIIDNYILYCWQFSL